MPTIIQKLYFSIVLYYNVFIDISEILDSLKYMRTATLNEANALLAPRCEQCGSETKLFGIERHPTIDFADLHTYVCATCDAVKTATVARDVAAEP
jgi:hypothetical protein